MSWTTEQQMADFGKVGDLQLLCMALDTVSQPDWISYLSKSDALRLHVPQLEDSVTTFEENVSSSTHCHGVKGKVTTSLAKHNL